MKEEAKINFFETGKQLEGILNEKYLKMQMFPLTETQGYKNIIAFAKGLGFTVKRHKDTKLHKLILNVEGCE